MYNIAVCDDDEVLCSQFERLLEPYIFEKKINVEVFYSGEELVKYMSEGEHFDLIFLDIELRLMNGVEVGRMIREDLENEEVQIVYISAKQQYAMELFAFRPMNFLVKPISGDHILKTIEKAMNLDGINKKCFEVKRGTETIRIPFGKIRYFESDNRKIIVHTDQGNIEMYEKLNNVELKVPLHFVRIHQSYLVNSAYVDYWKADRVHIQNLNELPISQNYRKKVADFLLNLEE